MTFSQLWTKLVTMNMITVLLGATGVLLLVAVVLSFGAMKSNTRDSEVEQLKQEIAALEAAQQLASQPNLLGASPSVPPAPIYPPVVPVPAPVPPAGTPISNPAIAAGPDSAFPDTPTDPNLEVPDLGDATAQEAEVLAAQIEAEERRFKEEQLRAENEKLKQENQTYKNEAGVAWQTRIAADGKNMARAETIKNAMLLARVTQWDKEHGFAVIEILQPDSVQSGTILAIRRQTGIYGQVTVDQMYPGSQATVNPIINTFLGEEGVDVQPGDELIIPPL